MHGFLTRLFLKVAPRPYKKAAASLGERAGTKNCERKVALAGFVTFALAALFLGLYCYSHYYLPAVFTEYGSYMIAGGLLSLFMPYFILYFVLYFRAESRKERIERYLPDMLHLISANIRSGMTPFSALRLAARDEFGDLKKEIEKATVKAMGTGSFSEALLSVNASIKSNILERALRIFISSLKSGGKIGIILHDIARDISENRALQKELETNTKTYTMFILFIVVFGTPFLLTVSLNFLAQITALQANTGSVGFGMGFLMGNVQVSTEFMFMLSIIMLIVTSFSASSLIGVIKKGRVKHGIKYFPFIAILCIVIFFAANYMLVSAGIFKAV